MVAEVFCRCARGVWMKVVVVGCWSANGLKGACRLINFVRGGWPIIVRAHDWLVSWRLVCLHKFQDMCHTTAEMCTWRLQCAETVRSDTHCICHVYRGPALLHKKSCARTILLARLRSGHWWVEGGTCYYHHTRALQAPPPRARNNHLGWNDSWDSLFSLNHASFPTVSFCAAKLVQRCSERDSRLYHLHSFASPSRVWWQYLFAFSKATRARELKSSGAKAAECSCSCSTEETGEAYTCGGIPGVLFTVTQLTPQLCTRGSYNIHTVFSVVVYTFLPGNASQDLFHKPCWNVHGTSFSIFRPEISGNLS